jgi:DNA processing protein
MDCASATHADARAWLRLTLVPGITVATQRALLDEFGSVAAIFAVPYQELATRAGEEIARLLAQGPDAALLDASLEWLARPGRHLVTFHDERYPPLLREISLPPMVLYAQGRIELLCNPCFAIVGSRNASRQGVEDAVAFARELSDAGLTIVSGLALGIDAAAHRGGLSGAGSSIAVMGTGPDIFYPRRNADLARELASEGCLLSEFALGSAPLPWNFPRRNRLISGLSRGVLVVEASLPSGSLSTAGFAGDQGRDVFAIPGSIHSRLSRGCHKLIKDGAKLAENAHDVLVELKLVEPSASLATEEVHPDVSDPVLAAMGFAPATFDQLAQRTGLDAATLAAQLARLEIEASVAPLPGGRFQRIEKRVIE